MTLQCPVSQHVTPPGGWNFIESSGVRFHSSGLNSLLNMIGSHRKAIGLDMSTGWQVRILDELCSQNPHIKCKDNPQAEGYEPLLVVQGRKLWVELHTHAKEHSQSTDVNIERWYQDWVSRVPNYSGCACREDFKLITQAHPPDLTPAGMEAWASLVHSLVSERLGKPAWVPE